jgi:hypothetical protein
MSKKKFNLKKTGENVEHKTVYLIFIENKDGVKYWCNSLTGNTWYREINLAVEYREYEAVISQYLKLKQEIQDADMKIAQKNTKTEYITFEEK